MEGGEGGGGEGKGSGREVTVGESGSASARQKYNTSIRFITTAEKAPQFDNNDYNISYEGCPKSFWPHIVIGHTNRNYRHYWKPIYLHNIGHSDTNMTSLI